MTIAFKSGHNARRTRRAGHERSARATVDRVDYLPLRRSIGVVLTSTGLFFPAIAGEGQGRPQSSRPGSRARPRSAACTGNRPVQGARRLVTVALNLSRARASPRMRSAATSSVNARQPIRIDADTMYPGHEPAGRHELLQLHPRRGRGRRARVAGRRRQLLPGHTWPTCSWC